MMTPGEHRATNALTMRDLTGLAHLILSTLVTLIPVEEHAHLEKRSVTETRYTDIAQDINFVLTQASGDSVLDSKEFEALLLSSIISFESRAAARVDSCKIGGPSWTIFQIAGNKKKICKDRKEAARVALAKVRQSFRACRKLPFEDRLSLYATGKCQRSWYSRSRVETALRLWEDHGHIKS